MDARVSQTFAGVDSQERWWNARKNVDLLDRMGTLSWSRGLSMLRGILVVWEENIRKGTRDKLTMNPKVWATCPMQFMKSSTYSQLKG